jgi:hypothetical protein
VSLKVYFTSEKNLLFSVCEKTNDAQKKALAKQEILSLDLNLNLNSTLQTMCSKNLYLVVALPLVAICKHLDITKKRFLNAVTILPDPDEDNPWVATVDMKKLR